VSGCDVGKMICWGAGRLEMELALVFGCFDNLACFRAQSICSRYIGIKGQLLLGTKGVYIPVRYLGLGPVLLSCIIPFSG